MLRRSAVVLLTAAGLAVVVGYLAYAPPLKAATSCSGKHVYPSQNLTTVAQNSPAGTTFCIHDGTYNVSSPVKVERNDRFVGVYRDSSRPAVVTTKAQQLFNTGAGNGAVINKLRISGAVGGNYCEPYCGRGIGGGGSNLTVKKVRLTGNKNQGIGGTGPGLQVEDSEIDHNGSWSFSGLDNATFAASAGIKSVKSMTVLNSHIHDNYWSGVWSDKRSTTFTVRGSTITNNGKAGIHFEVSDGPATFAGNKIKANGTLGDKAGLHAGILIVSSSRADIYNNTFGGTARSFGSAVGFGVQVKNDGRAPGVRGIKIHDNTKNGDAIVGCTLSGVDCWGN